MNNQIFLDHEVISPYFFCSILALSIELILIFWPNVIYLDYSCRLILTFLTTYVSNMWLNIRFYTFRSYLSFYICTAFAYLIAILFLKQCTLFFISEVLPIWLSVFLFDYFNLPELHKLAVFLI